MTDWPYTTSYWTPRQPPRAAPVEGDTRCEVLVIGGGFAGLSSAYHLKQADPELDVMLVEADYCGYGSSGRTLGIPAPQRPDPERRLHAAVGDAGLGEFLAIQGRLFTDYERFIARERLDCGFERKDCAWLATSAERLEYLRYMVADARDEAAGMTDLTAEEGAALLDLPVVGGVKFASRVRGAFDPYAFSRALRDLVLAAGVRVHEDTRAIAIDLDSRPVARTERGSIEADRVVVATNAYLDGFPFADGLVEPMHTYQLATAPLTDEQYGQLRWNPDYSVILEIDPDYEWIGFRMTPDRQLLLSIASPAYDVPAQQLGLIENDPAYEFVRAEFVRRMPWLESVEIVASWGAALDITESRFPFIGPLAEHPEVILDVGFSGHGIVQTFASGTMVTGLVLGADAGDPDYERMRQMYRLANGELGKRIDAEPAAALLRDGARS